MKRGVLVFLSLVLFMLFCLPVVAQPSTKSVETIIIDDFDTADGKDWSWSVQTSRFIADGFPKSGYVPGIPNSLRPLRTPEDPEAMVFGVNVSYDRKGDNWFEIYPSTTDENGELTNYEIPLQGLVTQLDFWAWGANYLYTLELMLRDADGRVHTMKAGTLNYNGWKNLVVNIPKHMIQQSRLRSGPKNLTFVGFRVRTDPAEFVDDFAIYFDQFKYTTHTLDNIYDGFDLRDVDFDAVNNGGQ